MLESKYPLSPPILYIQELVEEIRGDRNQAVIAHHSWWCGGYVSKLTAGELPSENNQQFASAGPDLTEEDIPKLEELLAACQECESQSFGASSEPAPGVNPWVVLLIQLLPVLIELLRKKDA